MAIVTVNSANDLSQRSKAGMAVAVGATGAVSIDTLIGPTGYAENGLNLVNIEA